MRHSRREISTPVQQIVEHSGTLFFSFQDLDATKPAGSVKIRVETIAYYLQRSSASIIKSKKEHRPGPLPLLVAGAAQSSFHVLTRAPSPSKPQFTASRRGKPRLLRPNA
jgi:hypothetical protein